LLGGRLGDVYSQDRDNSELTRHDEDAVVALQQYFLHEKQDGRGAGCVDESGTNAGIRMGAWG
jgi:hypothetical protein